MGVDLEKWFGVADVTHGEARNLDVLRARYLNLAKSIENLCPQNPDRTVAIRKLKESMCVAIDSIVCADAYGG